MSAFETAVQCPGCGQALVIPTIDLRSSFACPRCGTVHAADSLVASNTPLAAVPVAPARPPALGTPAMAPPMPNVPFPHVTPVQSPAESPGVLPVTAPAASPIAQAVASRAALPGQPNETVVVTPVAPASVEASALRPPAPQLGRPPLQSSSAFRYAARSSVELANVAERLDELLYRKRIIVLVSFALIVETVFHFAPEYYAWALAGYATLIYLLALARAWSLRDDEGRWSWRNMRVRVAAATKGAVASVVEIGTGGDLLRMVSATLVGAGLIATALGRPVVAILATSPRDVSDSEFLFYAQGAFCLGLAIRGVMFVRARHSQVGSSIQAIAKEWSSHSELPAIVDVWKLRDGDPLLSSRGTGPIFTALRSWKARGCSTEADYEESLKRHLKRTVQAEIEQQRPLHREDGQRPYRLDLVVANSVVLELKRGLSSSDADRAIGQIWKYAEVWSRGPVILVLCETYETFADGLVARHVADLRAQGKSVLVAAAGRRVN